MSAAFSARSRNSRSLSRSACSAATWAEIRVQQLANEHSLPITHGPDRWLEERLLARNAGVLPVLILLDGHATQEPSP